MNKHELTPQPPISLLPVEEMKMLRYVAVLACNTKSNTSCPSDQEIGMRLVFVAMVAVCAQKTIYLLKEEVFVPGYY